MRLTTRREIRNLISVAEAALPKTRSKHLEKCKDLFAEACVALWEGRKGRKRLVSCVRRLMVHHPTPVVMVPVASALAAALVCSIEPDEESVFEAWEKSLGSTGSAPSVSPEALDTLSELVEDSPAEYSEAA